MFTVLGFQLVHAAFFITTAIVEVHSALDQEIIRSISSFLLEFDCHSPANLLATMDYRALTNSLGQLLFSH